MTKDIDIKELLAEDARRRKLLETPSGRTLPGRTKVQAMKAMSEDFALWAEHCVKIRHKITGEMVPFVLNKPQLDVLAVMEEMRLNGEPIRLIVLKSRQWGGSTLVQLYMAWIQLLHKKNWHSLICAQVKDTSAQIRSMYTAMLENYPKRFAPAGGWSLKPFEQSMNTRVIGGRKCKVTVGSAESQDSSRGHDISMAHLSEVAFWRTSDKRHPGDLVRAVCSGIALEPMTLIAIESTANGVGNYFHREWLKAKSGQSAFKPVFVPWHAISMYSKEVKNPTRTWRSFDDYERMLWRTTDVTLGQLKWYHDKRREFPDHASMMAEYPSTAEEAFTNAKRGVFAADKVERLREGCREPEATGEIHGREHAGKGAMADTRFTADETGRLKLWERPTAGTDYVAVVDVGGRSESSDWSVIAVLARGDKNHELPRVVAQWRGHIDHDLLAWKAAAIASHYNKALLVVESNTFETDAHDTDGSYILDRLNHVYTRMYHRRVNDETRPGLISRVGFHTNRSTKTLIIDHLIGVVREGAYEERDEEAVNELRTYEELPNGGYAAREGNHDDILMTRAIGLYVLHTVKAPRSAVIECYRHGPVIR